MQALVTGAAGFLGSHIVEALLARGDNVVALDHRLNGKALTASTLARVQPIEADILAADAVERAARGCAAIFHCAAIVGVDAYVDRPTQTMETEVFGLRNVCAASRAQGRPGPIVITCSSSAVYGHAGGAEPLDEIMEVAPVSTYGIAKRFGELYLAAQYAEHGLRSAAMRIFNIYGPFQDERLVLPRFIRCAIGGQPLEIYDSGVQTRDFVFVADVVATMLAAASSVDGAELINACSGDETSVLELAQLAISLSGSTSLIVEKPRPERRKPFEVQRSWGSRARLETLFGPLPRTPLSEGVRRTIESMRRERSGQRRVQL
jgi:UDP-glucose 4-epimerase